MAKKKKHNKGIFSQAQLPVADAYTPLLSRGNLVRFGLLVMLAVGALVLADFFMRDGSMMSGGPLSTAHATAAGDCVDCHEPSAGLPSEKCSACHEVFDQEPGIYSYADHYLYGTDDLNRVKPLPEERNCAACHPEHQGREAAMTRVPDRLCTECHAYGSFGTDHPQFAFARPETPAPQSNLKFTHIHHVRELVKSQALSSPEESCLYCHEPAPGGKHFMPLDFDTHCDSCHLTQTIGTPRLPIAQGDQPGVETPATMRNRGGPSDLWADFANPEEFQQTGSRLVAKKPLHHTDPWIMANLRRIRGKLYDNAGLADLLRTTADVAPDQLRDLYNEAILTLRRDAVGLRGSDNPEVQAELARIDAVLDTVEARLDDPYAPLDESRFSLDLVPKQMEAAEREEWTQLVADLTEACRMCHVVSQATIARVQPDRAKLKRAEFDHGAHILQRGCLDCHNTIPIAENWNTETQIDPALDAASIVNLPKRETCLECHTPAGAGERCIDCHVFHPDTDRHTRPVVNKREEGP
ncbi:MAG: cytochrome c3 family protein [Acidobacteriota bacterium]|nr:cytochrome c3 family protein [Acidobacteriota bacterium]